MDKNISQLDPKLKEAYDRVMGTVVTPPAKAAQAMPSTPPPSTPTLPAAPIEHVNTAPVTRSEPAPIATSVSHQAVQSPVSTASVSTVPHKKSGSKAFIFLLAGITFFIVYALVWIKMFNLKFPFLNP